MRRALLAAALLAGLSAHAAPLDELRQIVADTAREFAAHDARLAALNADPRASEADYRAAFAVFNAGLDALQLHFVDAHLRAKAQVTAEQWEASPRPLESDDATTQELFGFLQTYDATAGDLAPVLQQLRTELLAREDRLIRSRFAQR